MLVSLVIKLCPTSDCVVVEGRAHDLAGWTDSIFAFAWWSKAGRERKSRIGLFSSYVLFLFLLIVSCVWCIWCFFGMMGDEGLCWGWIMVWRSLLGLWGMCDLYCQSIEIKITHSTQCSSYLLVRFCSFINSLSNF